MSRAERRRLAKGSIVPTMPTGSPRRDDLPVDFTSAMRLYQRETLPQAYGPDWFLKPESERVRIALMNVFDRLGTAWMAQEDLDPHKGWIGKQLLALLHACETGDTKHPLFAYCKANAKPGGQSNNALDAASHEVIARIALAFENAADAQIGRDRGYACQVVASLCLSLSGETNRSIAKTPALKIKSTTLVKWVSQTLDNTENGKAMIAYGKANKGFDILYGFAQEIDSQYNGSGTPDFTKIERLVKAALVIR